MRQSNNGLERLQSIELSTRTLWDCVKENKSESYVLEPNDEYDGINGAGRHIITAQAPASNW